MIAPTPTARTTVSAPAGAPLRVDARPSDPSNLVPRLSANRIRAPAVAAARPLANALIVAPALMRSDIQEPM